MAVTQCKLRLHYVYTKSGPNTNYGSTIQTTAPPPPPVDSGLARHLKTTALQNYKVLARY